MDSSITQDTTLARDAAALYDALSALIRVYGFRDRDRICCHDISVTQCYALEAVVQDGPLRLNDLAADLYLDKSTMSRVVGALERKGLLGRHRDQQDRRAILLEATPQGESLYRRIRRDIEEQEGRLLADFEPEVRTAMVELLRRLTEAARSRVSTEGGVCCAID